MTEKAKFATRLNITISVPADTIEDATAKVQRLKPIIDTLWPQAKIAAMANSVIVPCCEKAKNENVPNRPAEEVKR
jgi:hypothetical protein